ncbi:MAG: 50S ribosomal protein L20 [Candidatus Levybacteria bacterium RIFCSPHIGHO2_02_FULL_37_13]|nr:MAG: 50S ribosomal protein L20 [Candidatus Levybacteria bacterium RIFCSPHIGHO2_02_FULL_37_13]OGH29452.1 MAG: 50S ribosomal protein L20 [Candidatus Levybacteria bacterium RIFCSPHIGHO2_12_FULL_37_9]
MARIKRGIVSRRKHKKLLKLTKGYLALKSRAVRVAKQAALHAGAYAYHGRKLKKRDFRSLWTTRISEAVKQHDMSYNVFINKLKKANIELDRKILSDLVVNDPTSFSQIVNKINAN